MLAAAGVLWLWRRGLRALALVPIIVTAIFFVESGRAYYPLPADGLVVAAGAIALDRWLRPGRRMLLLGGAVALQAVVIALAGPIIVPLYSTRQLVSSNIWKVGYFKDEIGWQEMTSQVQRAWSQLPPSDRVGSAILAHNYGEASALAFYGRGLPAILSGHLSWQYWRPQHLPRRFVITLGYGQAERHTLCSSSTVLAHVENRWHLDNQELGQPIAACTLRRPLGSDWNRLIASDRL
jgi:hypothetical protein